MSCKYCDLKRRKDDDDDAEWIAGEDWESESDDGGYICPHNDGFRMLVYYDARCACTAVDNIKYCPFCGEELKAPKEPLIKDEKIRRAVRAWAEANGVGRVLYMENIYRFSAIDIATSLVVDFGSMLEHSNLEGGFYTIDELCGEGEE